MPQIEFWFEFGSNYSYLSAMRIEDAAARHNVRIVWKPFLLQDMACQCRKYGLRWTQPTTFPRLGVLPLRVALLGADQPWIGEFRRRVMALNFVLDQDFNYPDHIASILMELSLPASELLLHAQSEPTKLLLRQQTEEARSRRIFGAPTKQGFTRRPRRSKATENHRETVMRFARSALNSLSVPSVASFLRGLRVKPCFAVAAPPSVMKSDCPIE